MLGARIAAMRRKKGMSQSDMARRLKISASAMGMYEQGRREPPLDILVEMSCLLEVSTDYLLTGKPSGAQEERLVCENLLEQIRRAEDHTASRQAQPFSREELAVLFAAMLLET